MKPGFLFFLLGLNVALAEPAFHVAPPPWGNDQNDGRRATPFATPERARLAVRDHLSTHSLSADLVVILHAGIYELAAPWRFEPADSGRDGFAVVYRAAPGDAVTLSGGRRVTAWATAANGDCAAVVGPAVDFRQLWVDGRRAVRARTPNVGQMFALSAEKQVDGFDLPAGQLAGVALSPNQVEVSVLIAWMHKRLRIHHVVPQGDRTRAVIAPGEWDAVNHQPQGDRVYLGRHYWLENAREFLDAPGEFFLDRSAGVLHYRPRPGEDLATAVVLRPELEHLVVLAGRPEAAVHDLRFEGLTFAHTGWTRPNRFGFVDVQANSLVPADPAAATDPQYRHQQRKERIPAAFQAATADHIVVRNCRFTRLGGAGVVFTGGGNDNVIERNSFFDLAAGGIEFGEDAARPADPRLFPRRNRIVNNFLAHLGEDYFGSVPILGYYTDSSLIAHNEIFAVPYSGISQGWGWGAPPAPPESRGNRIIGNRLANYLRRLDDGGGLYTTDRQPGSELAQNYLSLMLPPDPVTKTGGAIYPDQFTEGFTIHHNVVTGAVRWLNLWNPNIRGNRVVQNYADTLALRNDSPDNIVEPVQLLPAGSWPEAARRIAEEAGLEPNAAAVRELDAPTEVIVESSSVDFQVLAGTWTTTDRSVGAYGASAAQSTTPQAAARWLPILPRSGEYEVSVWRSRGHASARYVIHHAEGTTTVSPLNRGPEDQWIPLGRFHFAAGFGSEVTVAMAPDSSEVTADTVRFKYVSSAASSVRQDTRESRR